MRYIPWITILVFLNSCSHNNHIEISKYHTVQLNISKNLPSKEELNNRSMRIVVLNIDHQINRFAKEANIGYSLASELVSNLVLLKRIQVIQRLEKPTFLNERKIYEFVKEHGVKLENADYLITGKITQADQNQRYHPSERDGSSPWVAYGACMAGVIKLFKLPSMQIQEVFPFNECLYKRQNIINPRLIKRNLPELLRRTVPEAIKSIMPKLTKSFRPKGYIESMRINGDKKIIKTTLNRKLGAIEGRRVKIIRVEKEKNLRGGEDIIYIPIGSGRISDIITDSYSFIIVDNLKDEVCRGDIVRVVD